MPKHPLLVGRIGGGLDELDVLEVGPVEQACERDQPTLIRFGPAILPIPSQQIEGIEHITNELPVHDEVAGDDRDGLKYPFRQPNQQALAVDAVDFSARLPDQNTAPIQLFLHRPGPIFEQAFDFLLVDRVERLRQETGDAIFLGRVLVWRAFRTLGVALGHFLPDQFVIDDLGGVVIHWGLGFGASAHCRSPATIGEVDDEQLALGFNGGLVHLVRRTLPVIQGDALCLGCGCGFVHFALISFRC